MAKIRSFVYCENIEQQATPKGTRATIIGPIGEICPINLPSNFSFAIACTISDLNLEQPNKLQVCFITPDSKVINDTGNMEVPIIQNNGRNCVQLNLQFNNLPLVVEGEYKTQVYVNCELVNEFPIPVRIDNRLIGKIN